MPRLLGMVAFVGSGARLPVLHHVRQSTSEPVTAATCRNPYARACMRIACLIPARRIEGGGDDHATVIMRPKRPMIRCW